MKILREAKVVLIYLLIVAVMTVTIFPLNASAQTRTGVEETNSFVIAPVQKDLKSTLAGLQQERYDILFGNQPVTSKTLFSRDFARESLLNSNSAGTQKKSWIKRKWWIFPVLAGVGAGVYFLANRSSSGGILCNDGTTSNASNRQGACSHHGGIRQ